MEFDIIDDVTCLTIHNAEPDDQAWYRCKAYNDIADASTDCELVVIEVPHFVKKLEDVSVGEGKLVR